MSLKLSNVWGKKLKIYSNQKNHFILLIVLKILKFMKY